MTPYQVYGLYIHPSPGGDVATLQADEEKLRYYTNKGFVFLGYVSPPGVTAGPRDIDRDDSGVPKGPDGSTHDRHPDEITPDRASVPWGFPMLGISVPESTPRTAHAVEASGLRRGVSNAGEADVRAKLKAAGVTDKDRIDSVLGRLRGGGLEDPQHEVRKLHQQATLPGTLVETGVTRGMTGVDLTMPPVVAGATSQYQQDDLERQGRVETREVEVAPGEVVMQQFAVKQNKDPQAPGDPPTGAATLEQAKAAEASRSAGDAPADPKPNPVAKSKPTSGASRPSR